MIAIAVVASLVVYAWVTGYIGGTTSTAGKAIQIQSFYRNPTTGLLTVYVQNVGQGAVEFKAGESVYVNDNLVTITSPLQPLAAGQTATLETNKVIPENEKVEIKVTTTDGTFMIRTGTPISSTNPTAGPTASPTPTPGPTASPTPTPTPTASPTPTPTPTASPTPTPAPTTGTFGNNVQGSSSQDIEDSITGGQFTCSQSGSGQSISAFISSVSTTHNIKCALYSTTGTLLGYTEEKSVTTSGDNQWITFNFQTGHVPSLSAGTSYVIVVWANNPSGSSSAYLAYSSSGGTGRYYDSNYNTNWPTPITFQSDGNRNYSVYCTYSVP
jgi:hypothetical protein